MKKLAKLVGIILIAVLLVVGGYVAYLFASYSRIDDNLALEVSGNPSQTLSVGEPHTAVTWNLGFGAYSDDYSFFMDGGTESWAFSKDAVHANIGGAIEMLQSLNADLMLLEEVDLDATRSYHVDETALICGAFPGYANVLAQNYDSAFLFYPFTQPHGASKTVQMTLSSFTIETALRRSLPIETGVMKFFDWDRCYSISRIPTENGRTLCLYNLHLSAYTSDGTIATEQLEMLLADMAGEYAAGNYVIAGGDFNKDLPGNSSEIFGVPGDNYTWAQPFPMELIPQGLTLVDSVDPDHPVPSCRNADQPYTPGQSFVLTVDGFIVSNNVQVHSASVVDAGFTHSDHNPVVIEFSLAE